MNVKAYAKINWYLYVKGKRPDGYHDLDMIMQHIDLHDDLYIENLSDNELRLGITGSDALSTSDDNLIIKAARLLQTRSGTTQGAYIRLEKRIPIGAGLGGGSADAAAVLTGLNRLWGLNYTLHQLQQIGLQIGADVPYCLEPCPAIVSGIGEQVQKVDFQQEAWLILLKPEASLSTKDVFAGYRHAGSEVPHLNDAAAAISSGRWELLYQFCVNSLQAPAAGMLPEICQLIDILKNNGALFAQMSGSGSAVFGVFETKEDAVLAYHRIEQPGIRILAKTLRTAAALSDAM